MSGRSWLVNLGRRLLGERRARTQLTPSQIKLLLESVKTVAASPDRAGRIFYDHLFRIAPETRSLFPEDMNAQQRKFIQTLVWVVSNLDRPERLQEEIEDLGRRHKQYGVRDEHYGSVRDALVGMVAAMSGANFTPDHEAAWRAAYAVVADGMKRA